MGVTSMSSPENKELATPVPFVTSCTTKYGTLSGCANGKRVDLNWLNYPAIAVDYNGTVLYVNAAMERTLGEDIRIQNHRLRLSDPKAREQFETLIKALKAGRLVPEVEPLVVKRHDTTPVVMRVMIIPEPNQTQFSGAAAILTFLFVGQRCRPAPLLLSRIFNLTPAEARLTCELASGSDLIRAACTLNISWETARTQLKTVFAKTNTHRQGELVALLSCLC